MAPECIAMEGVPTVVQKPKAIDIWGLGVTLYIMLSGRYPFQVHFICYVICVCLILRKTTTDC